MDDNLTPEIKYVVFENDKFIEEFHDPVMALELAEDIINNDNVPEDDIVIYYIEIKERLWDINLLREECKSY